MPKKKQQKNWYKEQLIPDRVFPLHKNILIDHIKRYKFASKLVKNKNVLDVACGCGYGSEILAKAKAKTIVAVDKSSQMISYAKKRYDQKNISFIGADAQKLPIKKATFDVVISFETIEHLPKYRKFLREIKRVLTKDGVLIISTPNSNLKIGDSNVHHTKEFNPEEFKIIINNNFKNAKYYFQKPINQKYLEFINNIMSKFSSNLMRCFIDMYFKSLFIENEVRSLNSLQKNQVPSVLIAVAKKT